MVLEVHMSSSHETAEAILDDKPILHIFYVDPKDNDLLPINNSDNYLKAIKTAKPILRLVVQRQGECEQTLHIRRGGNKQSDSLLNSMIHGGYSKQSCKSTISISKPSEFRQVSQIIDFDQLYRRVRLIKDTCNVDKPLGLHQPWCPFRLNLNRCRRCT